MLNVNAETVLSAIIDMDNKKFVGCKLTNCTLRYAGGQVEWDKNTTFIGCRWDFFDSAKRTVNVLNISSIGALGSFDWANEAFSTH